MKNILIRAGKDYFTNISPEATLSFRNRSTFGHNVGFYLISDSVYKLISTPNTSITPDSYLIGSRQSYKKNVAETINSEFDAFVLPVADFLKPKQIGHMKRLTSLIKNLEIPICVLGLGIGVKLDVGKFNHDKTNKVVKNFISSILDKSNSIGVRGDLTFKYLNKLGFNEDQIKVLGCPSIYLNGPKYNIKPPEINKDSKIALNITPFVKKYGRFVNKTIKNYKNYEYFMQDIRDLKLILYGEEWGPGGQKPRNYYNKILKENKAIFPIDSRSWINELKNFDYSIGTRLHGTIASLNARIPSTLVVHDSRTQEIADHHKIPYIKVEDISKDTSLKEVAESTSWETFNNNSKKNYKKLINFFKENKIDTFSEYPNPIIQEKENKIEIQKIPKQIYSKGIGINEEEILNRIKYLANEKQKEYKPPFFIANEKIIPINKDDNSIKKLKKLIRR